MWVSFSLSPFILEEYMVYKVFISKIELTNQIILTGSINSKPASVSYCLDSKRNAF
jgi:hypothetical protein